MAPAPSWDRRVCEHADTDSFLRPGQGVAISTSLALLHATPQLIGQAVELPQQRGVIKAPHGFMPYAADLPTNLSKILIEYRNRISPSITGRRSNRLFVNIDGTPKHDRTIARLIQRCLKKHLGIKFSPHQFRHLSVKVWTDRHPGDLETPQHFLGHAGPGTTANFYRELQTRRATRHFQQLVDEYRVGAPLKRRSRRRGDPDSREGHRE